MAKSYERPGGWQGLQHQTSTDRIIGSKEEKRSTKTFISSEKSSIVLGLIKNHAESLRRAVSDLNVQERHREQQFVALRLHHAKQAGQDLVPIEFQAQAVAPEPKVNGHSNGGTAKQAVVTVVLPPPRKGDLDFAALLALYPDVAERVREPEPLTLEELCKLYPGVQAWLNLHQELVEHGVSVQGFSLKVAAARQALEREQNHGESSIQTNKPSEEQ